MSTQNTDTIRTTLLHRVDNLSPMELQVLQALAVAAEAVSSSLLFTICTKAGLALRDETDDAPLRTLAPQLRRLRTLQLINEKNLINETIVEVITRRLYVDRQSTVKVQPKMEDSKKGPQRAGAKARKPQPVRLPTSTPLFRALVDAVRSELPAPPSLYYLSGQRLASACNRTLRELRIALLEGKDHRFIALTNPLLTHCFRAETDIDPLVRLITNPFDASWFSTLPPDRQSRLLSRILTHKIATLEASEDVFAYALNPALRAAASPDDRLELTYTLIVCLILRGRMEHARRLIDEIRTHDSTDYCFGFSGWIALIEGHLENALLLFAADLKELRRRQRKRTLFFAGYAAPFFILALLRKADTDSLRKADIYLDQAIRRCQSSSFIAAPLAALEAMLASQNGLATEAARRPIKPFIDSLRTAPPGLGTLFIGMALFSINGRLTHKEIESLTLTCTRAHDAGLDWLAMECAELLGRADTQTPGHRNMAQTLRGKVGAKPLTAAIEAEEPWRKGLRALQMAAESAEKQSRTLGNASRTRIIYLLAFSRTGTLTAISPLEQKQSTKGVWTKGRAIALQRLISGDKLEGLTEADQPLRAAIRRVEYAYGSHQHEFSLKHALPGLVGHPLLFLADAPTTPVEIMKGEPEILVATKGKELIVRFTPKVTSEDRHLLVRESPTRYRVIELTAAHHSLARILGNKGLTLPDSALEEVSSVLAQVASLVTVHSTIPGTAHSVETVAADPRPRVILLPHGDGFRLEILVKPLREGGPYLKPGQGAKNLMADVEGRRCQTERDLQEEKARVQALGHRLPSLTALPELDDQWFAETAEEALQVLLELQEVQEHGDALVEWPEGEKLKVGRAVSFADLHLRLGSADNWFEVAGELRLDEERILDMKKLLDLLQSTPHRFLPLGEGQFVALSRELRKRLDELSAYVDRRGKKIGVHPLAALALEDFSAQVGQLDADPQWHARLQHIREGLNKTLPLPPTLKAQLRDYQAEGFQWLARLAHLGFGACLADDMGLGKTVQTLAAILHRAPHGPTLVVAPTSVCANWVQEARRFAPTLRCTSFGGADRTAQLTALGPFDLMVTSYGLLHQESHLLTAVDWQTVVLDEAQAIKNAATKRSQAAMHLKAQCKIVTTGTPIENHLGEFWTLFNFINPGLLGSKERFNTRFAIPIERQNDREAKRRLKKLVQPFILRRLKSQVLEELPPRTEVVLQVELSPEETAFYEALRRTALERIEAETGATGHKPMQILAEITRLRQACCHPKLILPDSPLAGSKLALFGEIVDELLENGHKALVFSQFVGHLALIREHLDARHIPYRYLDGSTPPRERQREVEAFQAGVGDLFLISLKAGGLGLNLTAADYVIHMDPWWNPAVEDQASDRAHRIGQERPVTVYRLVAQHTIEEKIVRMHAEKRDLADSLLDETDASAKISAEELLRLIREPSA